MTVVLDLAAPDLALVAEAAPEPFQFAWAQNFDGSREWPLRSWAQMDHLAAGLGRSWETAFLIVRNTSVPRTAQLFGSAAECVVELLDGWNVSRAGQVGGASLSRS
ncbi:hypothetical protein ACX3O0_03325 [Homoserinimonas sp. A447]